MATGPAVNGLRCLIGDSYAIEAVFQRVAVAPSLATPSKKEDLDDEEEEEEAESTKKLPPRRHILLRLFRKVKPRRADPSTEAEENLINQTTIPWPEARPPNELYYEKDSSELIVKSSRYLAKMPFRMRTAIRDLVGQKSIATTTHKPTVFADIGRIVEDDASNQALVNFHSEFQFLIRHAGPIPADGWRSFDRCLKLLPAILPANSIRLRIEEQKQLVDLVGKRLESTRKDGRKTLMELVRRNILHFSIGSDLVRLFQQFSDGSNDMLIEFLHCAPILNEETIAEILKLCSKESVPLPDNKRLFSTLLRRPFERESLLRVTSSLLNANETVTIMENLLTMFDDVEAEGLMHQILNVIGVLLDGHSQQLIWDNEQCHERVQAVVERINEMVTEMEQFSFLCNTIAAKHLVGFDVERDRLERALASDYSIIKVHLRPKPRPKIQKNSKRGNRPPGPRPLQNVPYYWQQRKRKSCGSGLGFGGGSDWRAGKSSRN